VFGGMLLATCFGVLVVPTLYIIFQRLDMKIKNKKPAEAPEIAEKTNV